MSDDEVTQTLQIAIPLRRKWEGPEAPAAGTWNVAVWYGGDRSSRRTATCISVQRFKPEMGGGWGSSYAVPGGGWVNLGEDGEGPRNPAPDPVAAAHGAMRHARRDPDHKEPLGWPDENQLSFDFA